MYFLFSMLRVIFQILLKYTHAFADVYTYSRITYILFLAYTHILLTSKRCHVPLVHKRDNLEDILQLQCVIYSV